MGSRQLVFWLFCAALMLSPLLARSPSVRRLLDDLVSRVSEPEEDASGADEFGRFPATWYAVTRREKLLADVQRLRRLVATDMGMSAVRQIGNRIAYNQLLLELANTPELATPVPALRPVESWSIAAPPPPVRAGAEDLRWRPAGNVETLDFGWRH